MTPIYEDGAVPYGYEAYASDTPPPMGKGECEQFQNIAECMVVWDGDLISKNAVRKLVARGYVQGIIGGYAITPKGADSAKGSTND